MDRIFLEGIELFARGGVSAEERHVGQRYRLDISIETDLKRPGTSDLLEETISYADVYRIASKSMDGSFSLIESRAESIAAAVLGQTRAAAVTITLRKLLPPIPGTIVAAGVEIRRTRE